MTLFCMLLTHSHDLRGRAHNAGRGIVDRRWADLWLRTLECDPRACMFREAATAAQNVVNAPSVLLRPSQLLAVRRASWSFAAV